MSRSGDFNRLINTIFTIQRGPGGTANLVIDNLLSEVYQTMDREEREYENGPAFAVLKFYCHDASDPAQQGFLRLYYQIPFNDTLYASPEVREKDAESSPGHAEYLALTALHKAHCTVCTAVPPLMGYGEKKQSDNDYVPRGYILYVAWARVPGSPLSYELFWKETREYRDKVRAAFALAYTYVVPIPPKNISSRVWMAISRRMAILAAS